MSLRRNWSFCLRPIHRERGSAKQNPTLEVVVAAVAATTARRMALNQIETDNRPPETPMSALTMTSPVEAAAAPTTALAQLSMNDPFCQEMQQRARDRRAKQDETVGDLRVQLRRLEAALQAETKRRLAAVNETRVLAQKQLEEVQEKLSQSWKAQQDANDERLSRLEARIEKIEENWRRDHSAVVETSNEQHAKVQETLQEIREKMDKAREEQVEREGQLLQRLEDLSNESSDAWHEARQQRLAETESLQSRLERYDANVESHVQGLENTLRQELAKLQADLQREERERAATDEEICSVLNRYTEVLQTSLAAVS